jgi:hypothetical protein
LYAAIVAKPTHAIERAMTFSIVSPGSQRQYAERIYRPCHEKGLVIRPVILKCGSDQRDIGFRALRKSQDFKRFWIIRPFLNRNCGDNLNWYLPNLAFRYHG